MRAQRIDSTREVKAQYIDFKAQEELESVRKQLEDCLLFFSEEQLIHISKDDDLQEKAFETLSKKRGFGDTKNYSTNDLGQKCEECGEPLKPSQFARIKRDGQASEQVDNGLVCRNYPACPKAEKEIEK